MASNKTSFVLNGKHALNHKIEGVLYIDVKMTKRYIWIMKLRYIWAVIRARVNE